MYLYVAYTGLESFESTEELATRSVELVGPNGKVLQGDGPLQAVGFAATQMRACVYTYIYIYTHTYIHICIYIHIHIHICARVHMFMCVRLGIVYSYTCAYMFIPSKIHRI